jgi:hypothetical protein
VDGYGRCPDDIPLDLVFFTAFEDLRLQMTGTMESNGVRNCMSPPLFLFSMLEGLKTFLDGSLSFHAFQTAMLPPLFQTSTPDDKSLSLSAGALMVQALPRGEEAMFTRSTLGFVHSGAPNLALVACLLQKLN